MPDDDVQKDKGKPVRDDDTAVSDLAAKKAALAAGGKKAGSTDPADYPEKMDEDVSGSK